MFKATYVKLNQFLQIICELWAVERSPDQDISRKKVENLIADRENKKSFDTSWFVDLTLEEPQLTRPVRAVELRPLTENPGWLQITQSRFYFQPFSNVGSEVMLRYSLGDITYVYKRRHIMTHNALEIILKKNKSILLSFQN
eukprot:UN30927